MTAAEALINAPEFTVSELSSALRRTVEDAYGHVRVRGEISGFRGPHSSGHCYFALKDESAKIEAVIWKGVHGRMRFKPQEGLEVIATGKLTTYPGSSKYQIVIESLEPAGIGALMALMEERKKKLAAEGLFDEARKQLLPWLNSLPNLDGLLSDDPAPGCGYPGVPKIQQSLIERRLRCLHGRLLRCDRGQCCVGVGAVRVHRGVGHRGCAHFFVVVRTRSHMLMIQ